jgi:hypothetical protein
MRDQKTELTDEIYARIEEAIHTEAIFEATGRLCVQSSELGTHNVKLRFFLEDPETGVVLAELFTVNMGEGTLLHISDLARPFVIQFKRQQE